MQDIIRELQQRNVFRVGLAYLALAWLVIQVTDMAVDALNLPDELNAIVFYIGVIGFPFALFLAWAYELTPEGIKRAEDVTPEDSIRSATGRQLERLALALALLALAFVSWDAYLRPPVEEGPAVATEVVAEDAISPVTGPRSIAVLPFVNMSDDKDYFADGLSEELLNLLARIPGLKVPGRTSSFAFKGRNEDLRAIGTALGVETVLEGSVRRSGERLRVTAQLVEVEDGYHLWSQTYDRTMEDIFDIQDQIAGAIVDALKLHLDAAPVRGMPTQSVRAYELYLEAKPLLPRFDKLQEAEALLLEALELDQEFAEAWMGLAVIQHNLGVYGFRPHAETRARGRAYVDRAAAINPDLPEVKLMLLGREDLDSMQRNEKLHALLKRYPNLSRGYDWLGSNYVFLGWFSKALEVYDLGLEHDPFFPDFLVERGITLDALGREEESEATYLRWAQAVGLPQLNLWLALRMIDRGNEARTRELVSAFSESTGAEQDAVLAYLEEILDPATREAALDDSERWQQYMALPGQTGQWRAMLYIHLDDPAFFDALQRVDEAGGASGIVVLHLMGNYRHHRLLEDPRAQAMYTEHGFADIWREHGPPEFCQMGHDSWMCQLSEE